MALISVLPPAQGSCNTITFAGRTYSSTPGAPINVPDFDVSILEANGWTRQLHLGIEVLLLPTPTSPPSSKPSKDKSREISFRRGAPTQISFSSPNPLFLQKMLGSSPSSTIPIRPARSAITTSHQAASRWLRSSQNLTRRMALVGP